MSISTKQILRFLTWVSGIIFVGVCIEACAFIFNTFYTFFISSVNTHNFWDGIDLSELFKYDQGHFLAQTTFMIIVGVLRAILFYIIIDFLYKDKLNMVKPFNADLKRFILLLAYVSLAIGLFSNWGAKYAEWLVTKGVDMPERHALSLDGGGASLFMGVVLIVIAQIVKRGIEIQEENDLTV